jgi:hypothetical protein
LIKFESLGGPTASSYTKYFSSAVLILPSAFLGCLYSFEASALVRLTLKDMNLEGWRGLDWTKVLIIGI